MTLLGSQVRLPSEPLCTSAVTGGTTSTPAIGAYGSSSAYAPTGMSSMTGMTAGTGGVGSTGSNSSQEQFDSYLTKLQTICTDNTASAPGSAAAGDECNKTMHGGQYDSVKSALQNFNTLATRI